MISLEPYCIGGKKSPTTLKIEKADVLWRGSTKKQGAETTQLRTGHFRTALLWVYLDMVKFVSPILELWIKN